MDGKMSIEIGGTDNWMYCGEKREENEFVFNTGFYIQTTRNAQRSFKVTGQEYSLKTYADIPSGQSEEFSELIWLRASYILEETGLTNE
ncbi:MAG: hypothetical protein LIP01_16165 [Tannerellaceae bacterium]|nr:hypothetical protein [Tannerellaceae bacterium]